MTDNTLTKVIFRKWFDGSVIALFPEIPNDCNGLYCESYMHIGQHGGADCRSVIARTEVAKPSEYDGLHKELTAIGYNLKIIARTPRNDVYIRRQALKDMA